MDAVQQDVMQVLTRAPQPMSVTQVAHAIRVRASAARDALGYLVRHKGAQRHHCPDGVMRYSALAPKRAPRKRGETQQRSPAAEAVLAAIDAGHRRARDIAAASGVSDVYVSVVLHRLRLRGKAYSTGRKWCAEWHRTPADPALPPNLARAVRNPPHGEDGELPPCVGERMRDTTHDIYRAAYEAQDEGQDHEQS